MSSITEAMRDMPVNEAVAYKDGVGAGIEFMFAQILVAFDDDDRVVQWARDKRARWQEHTT